MADLIFSGTPEQRQGQIEQFCRRINSDFYGNGRVGAMQQMQEFMTDFKAVERERDLQHKQNRARMNLIIGLLGLLIMLMGLSPVLKTLFKTSVEFLPNVFESQTLERASLTQNASE